MVNAVPDWRTNPQGQLQFAWQEMQGPESRAFNALRSSTSLRGGVGGFMGFERPQGFSWGSPEQGHNFEGRLKIADQMLGKFAGSTGMAAEAAGKATGGLGTFANALTQFPAAPAAPAGGGIGSWFSSLFGMSASALSPAASAAISGGYAGGLYAMGAAFHGGNVVPFANGGIVGNPTLFAMSRGAGLMGEAGPEAVLPLKRGTDGKLGVAMGGKTGVTINVSNYSSADVKTRESPDGTTWDVVMEDRLATRLATHGTPLHKASRIANEGRLKRR